MSLKVVKSRFIVEGFLGDESPVINICELDAIEQIDGVTFYKKKGRSAYYSQFMFEIKQLLKLYKTYDGTRRDFNVKSIFEEKNSKKQYGPK